MKKVLCGILFLLSFSLYGNAEIEKWYESYPFQNPYDATIIGSSMIMTQGVSEKIPGKDYERSEEHTSELQSRQYLVCRLLLEKKYITLLTQKRLCYS